MPAGRTNAAALLQKVNSQLRGERVPLQTKEEDELATYLSSLTQRTQQARSLNYEEQGDVSVSSGVDGLRASHTSQVGASGEGQVKLSAAGSKFLKKKKSVENEEDSDGDMVGPRVTGDMEGIVISGGRKGEAPIKSYNKMSALDKASAIDKKMKGRHSKGSPMRRFTSGESDSEDSIRGSEIVVRPGSADTSIGRDGPKFLKNRNSVEDESRLGLRSPSPQMHQRSSSIEKKKKKKKKEGKDSKTKGEIVRTLGHVYLTSEEESLAEFIHGLSVSESSGRKPQNLVAKKQQKWRKKAPGAQPQLMRSNSSPVPSKSRSPSPFKRSPSPYAKHSRSQSQDSDIMLDSMDSEIVDDRKRSKHRSRSRPESVSSEDRFNIHLMDVASLLPSSPKQSDNRKVKQKQRGTKKTSSFSSFKASSFEEKDLKSRKSRRKSPVKRAESQSSLFENLGIHMVDELIGGKDDRDVSGGESDSEIKTERSDDRRRVAVRNQSESEIVTEIGADNMRKMITAATPFKAVVAQSVSELIGTARKEKTESSADDTDVENLYSESFASGTESKTMTASSSLKSDRSDSKQTKRRQRTSFVDDDSYSERSRSRRKKRGGKHGNHKLIVEEKQVDISTADRRGGLHHWQSTHMDVRVSGPYGLQYVDPAPVATHVISADALEALTAYSPNVMALQEMMRAQLDLVRNFVDLQNRIYKSCLDGLNNDYKYTTLEDTKQYIEEHRKPRMTFKEALKLVEQEEGLTAS